MRSFLRLQATCCTTPNDVSPREDSQPRPRSVVRNKWAWFLLCIALSAVACGLPGQSSQSSPTVASSPPPDAVTRAYAHTYHDKYVTARGDGYNYCVVELDLPNCRARGIAMIAVWESFLKDLNSMPPAPKVAADVRTIRNQLPKGVDDLSAMVAAAGAQDKTATLKAADAYISDMVPTVTNALGDIYAPWRYE